MARVQLLPINACGCTCCQPTDAASCCPNSCAGGWQQAVSRVEYVCPAAPPPPVTHLVELMLCQHRSTRLCSCRSRRIKPAVHPARHQPTDAGCCCCRAACRALCWRAAAPADCAAARLGGCCEFDQDQVGTCDQHSCLPALLEEAAGFVRDLLNQQGPAWESVAQGSHSVCWAVMTRQQRHAGDLCCLEQLRCVGLLNTAPTDVRPRRLYCSVSGIQAAAAAAGVVAAGCPHLTIVFASCMYLALAGSEHSSCDPAGRPVGKPA